jgi:acyl-CoA synthetase
VFIFRKIFNIHQTDVIFTASPFTFDPSIVDLFLTFSTGARMVLVKPSIKAIPSKLAEIIRKEGVTFLQATPSFFLQFGPQLSKTHLLYPSSPLRIIVLGGEAFPALKTLSEFSSPGHSTVFYNIYGITEVSCWATLSKIESNEIQVDLGHALGETDLRVINEDEEEIHRDQGGEGYLWLGGRRICLLNDETPDSIKKPVFRPTGDRVEFLNGKLYYRGRKDETVKRMGKRLNLHSVEILALSSGLVQQCCALLDSNRLLVLVCNGISVVDHLLQFFQENAAAVEQPDVIRILDSLPMSKHGKIDRKKLLKLIQTTPKHDGKLNWETILANEWRNATGQTATDESNFILSGGNSLSALRLVNQIQEETSRSLPLLTDILLNQNWKETVDYIRKESLNGPISSLQNQSKVEIFQRSQTSSKVTDVISKASTLELKQIWKFNLKKCIDASPLVIRR